MKFYKDEGIPVEKIGEIVMRIDAKIRVTRLSDGFVCHRKNKPIKNSEYWDASKYRIEQRWRGEQYVSLEEHKVLLKKFYAK